MDAKHTPGPWTVEEYGDDETPTLVIHKDSESRVCFMATPGSHGDPAKIEADAYLIAAAPELLAALTDLMDCLSLAAKNDDMPLPLVGYGEIFLNRARAAIASATSQRH